MATMQETIDEMRNRPVRENPEQFRIRDGYLEIFGGEAEPEASPYQYLLSELRSGRGVADFLRQIASKAWAQRQPESFRRLINFLASNLPD